MRLLVTGGRGFTDKPRVFARLDELHRVMPVTVMIQGGAKGADQLAQWWAVSRGICCVTVEAHWGFYEQAAGHVRNGWMLQHLAPDLVLVFPGGNGTANMREQAQRAGLTVIEG